jgi:hypothetical protein
MELATKDNGSLVSLAFAKAEVYKFGLMAVCMKASGVTIKRRARAD